MRREHDLKLVTSAVKRTQELDTQSTSSLLPSLDESDQRLHILSHIEESEEESEEESVDVKAVFDLQSSEPMNTDHQDRDYRLPAVTYDNSAWKLTVRKQVNRVLCAQLLLI